MEFLENANLPCKRVSCVIADERIDIETKKTLENEKIKIIYSKAAVGLTSPIKSHPDIVFHHLKDNFFVCEPTLFSYFQKQFEGSGAKIIKGKAFLENKYPNDCSYNAARISESVFAKLNCLDKAILDFDNENYTKKININQGYGKCSICIVSKNALITSDDCIFKAANQNGFDVLKISEGNISLSGYNYGFIGGASGLLSNDTMAFFGELKTHPDCENIKAFLKNYKISPLELCKGTLSDFGSILPIAY